MSTLTRRMLPSLSQRVGKCSSSMRSPADRLCSLLCASQLLALAWPSSCTVWPLASRALHALGGALPQVSSVLARERERTPLQSSWWLRVSARWWRRRASTASRPARTGRTRASSCCASSSRSPSSCSSRLCAWPSSISDEDASHIVRCWYAQRVARAVLLIANEVLWTADVDKRDVNKNCVYRLEEKLL